MLAPDGTVGSVGAVPEKIETAAAAGVDYLLVPLGVSTRGADGSVRVVAVATLEEAIEFCRSAAEHNTGS